MKVFLDTNILLDIILERPGFEAPLEVLQKASDGFVELYASYLTMANIAYILRKNYKGALIPTIKQLSSLLTVLPMGQPQLEKAMLLDGPDFEDILQAVCAEEEGCEIILTHNPAHFKIGPGLCPEWNCPQVYTAEEFLASPYLYDEKHN